MSLWSGQHLSCSKPFDGVGGELAHALKNDFHSQIHMDDDDPFALSSQHETNVLQVQYFRKHTLMLLFIIFINIGESALRLLLRFFFFFDG